MMTLRIESFSKHWKTLLLRAAFSSVQFSCSVVSDSLQPHELQHTRPPCPSPTHGVYSNSCPLSQWCPSTISCSVVPFFCPQSFPASGSFQMSQLFASGGQSIGVSYILLLYIYLKNSNLGKLYQDFIVYWENRPIKNKSLIFPVLQI